MVMTKESRELYERLIRAYFAVDPTLQSLLGAPGVYWVMNLDWYKQIRTAFAPEDDRDPDEWEGDHLLGVPVRVREDGGEPHIETGHPLAVMPVAVNLPAVACCSRPEQ